MHSVFAIIVLVLGLVLLILSYFAKLPGGAKWAGFTFLAIVVQWVLAIVSFAAPVVGVLHGANAFAILALAEFTARRTEGAAPVEAAPATAAP
jgi:heme A synthase